MHYYNRNIGDYAKKAGRLSMLQHGAYTLLMDACYDRERFPTLEEALDWAWASSTDEQEAVKFILSKFFTLTNGFYVQARVLDEITDYQEKAATNKAIAIEREANKRINPKPKKGDVADDAEAGQPKLNQISIDEYRGMGVEDIKKYTALSQLMMLGISKETAIEYIDVRKSKKAPLTKSAILILFSEAEKASISAEQAIKTCCEESWRGFKAEWYLRLKPSSSASVSPIKNGQFKTAAQQREENNNAVGDRFIEKMLGATLNTNEIIIEGEVLNG